MNKTDLVVLGLIFEQDRYGYEIIHEIKDRQFEHWANINPASIYNRLRRLEKIGALSSRSEKVGRQPERRIYSLTESGRVMLSTMVLEALSSPLHWEYLNHLGMAFVYCADRVAVLCRIRERLGMLERAIEHIHSEIEKRQEHIPLNWILLMEASADRLKIDLKAFRSLAENIESGALARSCERVASDMVGTKGLKEGKGPGS